MESLRNLTDRAHILVGRIEGHSWKINNTEIPPSSGKDLNEADLTTLVGQMRMIQSTMHSLTDRLEYVAEHLERNI